MRKLIGSAAFGTALMGVFMPLVTIYMVWLALTLAAVAGLLGGRLLPVLTLLVCFANLFFFSPVSTALLGSGVYSLITTAVLFLIAIGALVLSWRLKLLGDE